MTKTPMTFEEAADLEADIAGVYVIYFTGDPKKGYVGSSKCVRKRLMQHRRDLATGRHKNYKLRALYITFTERDFRCMVLEECEDITQAREREQIMIDFIGRDNLYNLDGTVRGI